jgi:hypothetical protein
VRPAANGATKLQAAEQDILDKIPVPPLQPAADPVRKRRVVAADAGALILGKGWRRRAGGFTPVRYLALRGRGHWRLASPLNDYSENKWGDPKAAP